MSKRIMRMVFLRTKIMTRVVDYTVILDDESNLIGDGSHEDFLEIYFEASNPLSTTRAFITLTVKGMTNATNYPNVHINGNLIRSITNSDAGGDPDWRTQTITFPNSYLF